MESEQHTSCAARPPSQQVGASAAAHNQQQADAHEAAAGAALAVAVLPMSTHDDTEMAGADDVAVGIPPATETPPVSPRMHAQMDTPMLGPASPDAGNPPVTPAAAVQQAQASPFAGFSPLRVPDGAFAAFAEPQATPGVPTINCMGPRMLALLHRMHAMLLGIFATILAQES